MRDMLDGLDRKIVALLQKNGRIANLEVSRQLGIAEATVRKRVERLLEEGTIKVTAIVDAAKSGYTVQAIIGVQAEPQRVQEAAQTLASLPAVRSVSITAGAFDLIAEAAFTSNDALYRFLTEEVARMNGVLRSETFHVLKAVKSISDWQLPEASMEAAKKVLVVDDDPTFLMATKTVLMRNGYRVITAVNGTQGLDRARQERPDLVVLDYMMATPTEGSLVSWLLKEDPQLERIPILLVTAVGRDHPWWKIQPEQDALPVDGWLDKPVAPDRLLSEVERLLVSGVKANP